MDRSSSNEFCENSIESKLVFLLCMMAYQPHFWECEMRALSRSLESRRNIDKGKFFVSGRKITSLYFKL